MVGHAIEGAPAVEAFLLRHARRYPGKTSWTTRHERWIAAQCFDHEADRIALAEYQLATQSGEQRVQRLTIALTEAAQGWRFEGVVAALRALRGIDTVSAIGLVCEIGDIGRFASARQLMGYLGLVPSEHSSGNSIHRGSITKTGNAHARRLLTEAAWNYFPAGSAASCASEAKALPGRCATTHGRLSYACARDLHTCLLEACSPTRSAWR
jgi:transposase